MLRLRLLHLLLSCVALCVACSRSETIPARTQVLLQVSCDDAELRARLTQLDVSLVLEESSGFREPVKASFPREVLKWPVEFPITPRVPADANKRFEVMVEAKQDDEVLVQTRAIAGFALGQLRTLALELRACGDRSLGFVCAAPDCRGESCDVCTDNGSCEPVSVLKPEDLSPFVPGQSAEPVDRGTGSFDASAPGPDADSDGSSPDRDGDGCDASGGARCVCDSGFESDGKGGCNDPDDCPPGACSGGSCVDGSSDYSCVCGQGFTGSGSKKCTPAIYCPENACYPGGSCVDVQNWSCTCDAGFSGSGTRACANIDDCPKDRCKAPNGTCQDGVSSYTCKCNPGFSGPDCTNDICSPNPCRNGGTCARTGTLCTCASGFSGDNCETSLDRCAAGVAAVCGAGATKCTSTAGSFSCTCAGNYAPAPDGKSCKARAWSAPMLLEQSDQGSATAGPLALDSQGNTMAVWTQSDGTHTNVWARVLSPSGTWGSPTLIENSDAGDADSPTLVLFGAGNALVAWRMSDGATGQGSIWAARYTSGRWEPAKRIDNGATTISYPKATVDSDGNATVVWMQAFNSTAPVFSREDLWVNTLPAAGVWGTPALLQANTSESIDAFALAGNGSSQAIAIWSTNGSSMHRTWESHRANLGAWSSPATIAMGTSSVDALDQAVFLTSNRAGDALAVTPMLVGGQRNLYTNLRIGGTWRAATPLTSTGGSGALLGDGALSDSGDALFAWMRDSMGSTGRRVVVSRALAAGAWGADQALQQDTIGYSDPPVLATFNTNAVVLHAQHRQLADDLRAVYIANGVTDTSKLIATGAGAKISRGGVVVYSDGRAMVTWTQLEGTGPRTNAWFSRLE